MPECQSNAEAPLFLLLSAAYHVQEGAAYLKKVLHVTPAAMCHRLLTSLFLLAHLIAQHFMVGEGHKIVMSMRGLSMSEISECAPLKGPVSSSASEQTLTGEMAPYTCEGLTAPVCSPVAVFYHIMERAIRAVGCSVSRWCGSVPTALLCWILSSMLASSLFACMLCRIACLLWDGSCRVVSWPCTPLNGSYSRCVQMWVYMWLVGIKHKMHSLGWCL